MSAKPVRRVVTGHNAEGRAVVTADSSLTGTMVPSGASFSTTIWTTATAPVNNDDTTDGGARSVGLTLPGGSVLRIIEMVPGKRSPMHRTNSLDYGIVISGSLELELDDGAVTLVEPGDIVIQRGTIHAWRNPSADTPARIAFILLDATPATVNGKALPDIMPSAAARS